MSATPEGQHEATPATSSVQSAQDDLRNLELPKMDPISLFRKFGPGIILMMTGVGTSHLVSAPVAGGRHEYLILWVIPVAYIVKYYGFQMAFRFTNATGYSVMDAMATTPGKWAVWYTVVINFLQASLGQAGRLAAAAAVLFFMGTEFGGLELGYEVYGVLAALLCGSLVLAGRYGAVETAAKVFIIILAISAVFVFVVQPPPLSAYAFFVQFSVPVGSMMVIGAFLGLLPTGLDVSVQSSEWGKAKKAGLPLIRPLLEKEGLAKRVDPFAQPKVEEMGVDVKKMPEHAQEYVRRYFRIGVLDFTFGHVVSGILAIIFLTLAAVWLYPSPVEGTAVMGEIAGIFTRSVGPHMMWVFLIGATAALVSTVINYYDGIPRVLAAAARNLFMPVRELQGIEDVTPEKRRAWYSEYNLWRILVVFSMVTSTIFVVAIPRPVFMVLLASVLALLIAPVLFFLNFWFCLRAIPKDDTIFYPSKFVQWFSWVTLAIFSGLAVWVAVLQIGAALG